MSKTKRVLGALTIVVLSVTMVAGLSLARDPAQAGGDRPSIGRVPDDAFDDAGMMIRDRVPDYVAVWNREGTAIAGYVEKDVAFPPPTTTWDGSDDPWPVYDESLSTVVGHMYPSRGFIAIGEDPESVPLAREFCSDDGKTVVEC